MNLLEQNQHLTKKSLFPDWYKLHDKYVNFDQSDFVNVKLDNLYNTNEEKEIIKINKRTILKYCWWCRILHILALKKGRKSWIDYTYGYVTKNIPVDGNLQKLNENLLNIGLFEKLTKRMLKLV